MSDWLDRVLGAKPGFEQELVDRYSRGLLEVARRQLPERARKRLDPEDVVQSVYRSFFRRLNEGRFSFEDSHDVWRLLAAMTFHKATKAVRFHEQERRDVRREVPLSSGDYSAHSIGKVPEPSPQPEDVATLFDSLEQLLARVPENYRDIVLLRLEGHSIPEIASKIDRSQRTVLRALARLKELAASQLGAA